MNKILKRLGTLFLFTAMLSLCNPAQSQVLIALIFGDKLNSPNLEFGLEGGFSRSYLRGIEESKGYGHLHLGFYFDIRIKNNLWLNTGVRAKTNSGARNINPYSLEDPKLDSVFLDGHINRNIGYFYIPIHLKYRFGEREQFFVNAGGQFGLRHKANDLFFNTYEDTDDVSFKKDIRDEIKRFDLGLSGGLGYKFKGNGMNLGVTYYHGLINIMKDSDLEQYNRPSKNSSIYIYVDIPVGANKEKD